MGSPVLLFREACLEGKDARMRPDWNNEVALLQGMRIGARLEGPRTRLTCGDCFCVTA